MKRPSFQFYPADWLRDTALRSCSAGARGLWMDMICYMHEGNPYGYLKVGDKVILPDNLARMAGEAFDVVKGWLDELQSAGVYSLSDDGAIYSKRMVRDEHLREARAKGGHLGGNPALKVNHKDNQKVEKEDKQNPTPSSSSSSSSSEEKKERDSAKRASQLPDNFYPDETGVKYAEERNVNIAKELETFKNYHIAKGTTMKSWQAAWRTWCGKAVEYGRTEKQSNAWAGAI
jgi:hypothetical protein